MSRATSFASIHQDRKEHGHLYCLHPDWNVEKWANALIDSFKSGIIGSVSFSYLATTMCKMIYYSNIPVIITYFEP